MLAQGENKKASPPSHRRGDRLPRRRARRARSRQLAEEGIAGAGLFGKSQWKEVLRLAALRGA